MGLSYIYLYIGDTVSNVNAVFESRPVYSGVCLFQGWESGCLSLQA